MSFLFLPIFPVSATLDFNTRDVFREVPLCQRTAGLRHVVLKNKQHINIKPINVQFFLAPSVLVPCSSWLLYLVDNPALPINPMKTKSSMDNFTSVLGSCSPPLCHCAVKLQHQPFTAQKDKSSSTTVSGLFCWQCDPLFSGHMVSHSFWKSCCCWWWWELNLPTARSSTL